MDAFIHESHRMATILPLVAHATSVDTTLENCSLPKDTEGKQIKKQVFEI